MRLYTIPHRTYKAIKDNPRPGEIMLLPDLVYAYEIRAVIRSFGHYLTRESTWEIRTQKRVDRLGTIEVTAYSHVTDDPRVQTKNLLFLTRQNARRLGREFCAQAGIRWKP